MKRHPQPDPNRHVAIATRILRFYGLQPQEVWPPTKGYRNTSIPVRLTDGRLINLIIYKREPGIVDTIRRADSVSNFVAERGLPTRHSLANRLIVIKSGDGQPRYAHIYDYLPGETIPWEAYNKGHLKALGMGMSVMHHILLAYEDTLPDVEDAYYATLQRMFQYFSDPGVQVAMAKQLRLSLDPTILRRYAELLQQCKQLDHRQPLHMDFVRGNILFLPDKVDGLPVISGVLDFEKTATGHPLFDVARTLAFLLVDCKYKSSEKVTKYFLESGYIRRGPLSLQKITIIIGQQRHDLLAMLLDMFLLHDLYKFLRHNPYEALKHNEHYKRTRKILLDRKLVQQVKR